MRLDEAANVVAAVKTATDKPREQERILYSFLLANQDSLTDFCSLLYGPALLRPEHIMSALHRSYAIFPEEFELIEGAPLVPSLVSESPDECDVTMTIPEALHATASIKEGVDIAVVMGRMDKISAECVWRRTLGEAPMIPRKRLLRAIAHGGDIYSPERLTSALSVEPLAIVMEKALNGELSENFDIEPGHPFKAPSFAAWRYWSKPFENTYYDIVKGPRRYAHKVQGEIFLYDSQGRLDKATANITYDGDCVALIDESGDVLEWLHTDDEPDIWAAPYEDRAVAPKIVKSQEHMRQLCENLNEGEALRLIDGDRPHIHNQHKGGFILPRRIYELPLLITQGKTKSDGIWATMRIEAMDGFDPIHVGYANIKKTNMPDNPVLRDGVKRFVWTDLEPPLVGSFHALRCREGNVEGAYLVSLATNKGMSDVMQYGDLWSIDGHGQAR
tara:strand:- start:1154 stop:2491 length:1338 start_codon:yes stop_codon:yes gene_type:complete